VNGQMMKIVTKSGRIVETTTSHSHLVRRNQTIEPITGADMVKGKTVRKITSGRQDERAKSAIRRSIVLTLLVEKVDLALDTLRISGIIRSPQYSYQAIIKK